MGRYGAKSLKIAPPRSKKILKKWEKKEGKLKGRRPEAK